MQKQRQSTETFNNLVKKMSLKKLLIILSILTVIVIGVALYVGLTSISIYNTGLRFLLVFLLLIWSFPIYYKMKVGEYQGESLKQSFKKVHIGWKISLFTAGGIAIISILLSLFTAPLFMANKYRDLITVNETANFQEDIDNHSDMLIPIVDKDLAKKLGDKKLGEDNLGSQYDINEYTLCYYNDDIYWIGAIEHSGFFRWFSNQGTGAPGFIKISATKTPYEVEMVKYSMKYIPSAYFGQDLERKIYFSNMDKLRDGRLNLELDENGNPMYVQSVIRKEFAFTSGDDTRGVITLDPKTGASKYYDEGKEPAWIDRVQSTELVQEQLNNWGSYKHGFFNTLFSKKEMTMCSSGYAYITNTDAKGNPCIYLYTGMTSVGTDESMVGVALVNLTTKEANLYKVAGATEEAAMKSAQGMIQEKKYIAAWPILLNYEGEPSYLIPLKDNAGLVKAYAYVNLKDYSKVGWGYSISEAQTSYNEKLGLSNVGTDDEIELTIDSLVKANDGGDTYYFIKFSEKENLIYKAHFSVNEELLFKDTYKGLKVKVTLRDKQITSLKLV